MKEMKETHHRANSVQPMKEMHHHYVELMNEMKETHHLANSVEPMKEMEETHEGKEGNSSLGKSMEPTL